MGSSFTFLIPYAPPTAVDPAPAEGMVVSKSERVAEPREGS
ncbi:MAG: hypothetical protein V1924_06020 [Candidatus Bathyarchaeota archaeon]